MASAPTDFDPRWAQLRRLTAARIGLRRAGSTLATSENLAFQLAHAEARDAVHEGLDAQSLADQLRARGLQSPLLHSAAGDRGAYLVRPDLGRALDPPSRERLRELQGGFDIVFVIADGLSSRAVARHALPLLDGVLPALSGGALRVGPAPIVLQGRVAIGDEIGQILKADLVAILIGERPGLTSPDSLGVYLTWAPRIGCTDAERNCLSNIRPEGMSYAEAAQRLLFLCSEAKRRRLTGVHLKDESIWLAPPPSLTDARMREQGNES